ncbi:H-NS histone family protein [Chitinimonas sp. BJYL2]|uniref:H-NS histone family protein n=1 Tax=Chitinimonas sp. BJYL2 TaxID=2976696 RepID=UPI0022B59B5D|nr:H-NS histone family protein [Chitinimonas sp. BJYL2]
MTIDLTPLSLPQLHQLKKEVEAAIPCRQQADKLQALNDLKQLAADRGFSIDELLGVSGKASKTTRGPVAVKYRAKDGQTWSGRGRKPLWVVAHLAAGGKLDDLAA